MELVIAILPAIIRREMVKEDKLNKGSNQNKIHPPLPTKLGMHIWKNLLYELYVAKIPLNKHIFRGF